MGLLPTVVHLLAISLGVYRSGRHFLLRGALHAVFYVVLDFHPFATVLGGRDFYIYQFLPFLFNLLDFKHLLESACFLDFEFAISHLLHILWPLPLTGHLDNFILSLAHLGELINNLRVCILEPVALLLQLCILIP